MTFRTVLLLEKVSLVGTNFFPLNETRQFVQLNLLLALQVRQSLVCGAKIHISSEIIINFKST